VNRVLNSNIKINNNLSLRNYKFMTMIKLINLICVFFNLMVTKKYFLYYSFIFVLNFFSRVSHVLKIFVYPLIQEVYY
jgi:uncharacterized membrane protein (DUF373 family)